METAYINIRDPFVPVHDGQGGERIGEYELRLSTEAWEMNRIPIAPPPENRLYISGFPVRDPRNSNR